MHPWTARAWPQLARNVRLPRGTESIRRRVTVENSRVYPEYYGIGTISIRWNNKISIPPHRGKENYRGNEIIRQCSFLSMTDSEREDTYIGVGEDFEQYFYRATSMNDVCTSVQLNSLLNRASELFDGNGGFDEPWNSLGLAIVGAWNLSSRLSIRSNDIQPYCAPYKEGNSTVNMYRVRRYFRYLPFIQGNRMACLFFEHIRYDTVFPSCRG